MAAQIYNTGDTVIQLFAGLTYTVSGASVVVGSFTNSGDVAFCSDESTSTGRGMSGTVFSPRDAAKKTLYEGRGYNDAGNVIRHLEGFAVDADDDDTIRFLTTVGTFTGSVEIEWYYN